MADPLVDELRELAGWLDVPEAPDLRAGVRSRLRAPVPPPWWAVPRRWLAAVPRRWLAAAAAHRLAAVPRRRLAAAAAHRLAAVPRRWLAAAAAVAVAVVIAVVPPARAAVADAVGGLLRFAGVEIRDEPVPGGLPVTPSPLPSISSADLDEARRVAKFPIRVPVALGVPERVEVADPAPDGAPRVVTMSYRGGSVRLDQFDGQMQTHFLKTAPDAKYVQVDGDFAVWFPGPHALVYVDRAGQEHTVGARLAGPTLIWTVGEVSYRLEGVPDLVEATTIAESLT
jgi:hypothetical protein